MMANNCISVENLNLFYGDFHALKNVNMHIEQREITALIGPSGCGKSSMLRCFNRMNDLIDGCKITGKILINDRDIYGSNDVSELRKKVGMVFQKPNVFPMTVYDNVAFGPRTHGIKKRSCLEQIVFDSLKNAGLWDEVKDRLYKPASELSGGQQQRLCIARALAIEPEILLMDEPTSALDPLAMNIIEELLKDLKQNYTIIIVTHNIQQAARISDKTAFFLLGEMLEFNNTRSVLDSPQNEKCKEYITGIFG